MQQLIRNYPLGILLTQRNGQVAVNYAPFLFDDSKSETLATHLPRANSVWQELADQSVTVLFHGPNAYISPSWYPSKHAHGKAVPTWNYAAVHVRGVVRVIEEPSWLHAHLEALTNRHEQQFALPWKVTDAPPEYIAAQLRALVGLEIVITNVEGKFKLSQNRSLADQAGVIAGLTESGSVFAEFMRRHT